MPVVLPQCYVHSTSMSLRMVGSGMAGYAYKDAVQTARADHLLTEYPRAGGVWETNDGDINNNYEGIDLHADVLKVGHHGSAYRSSPAFIGAVHPKYAIISVGRHNMFGHPATSTIATLDRFGARVYRTDENGAVTMVSDGKTHATIRSFLKP